MKYPLISEYIESIKHSEDNFNVLSTLRPVYDEAGEIVMSSGNFAVVFKMKDESSGKLYAVKCFLREQEGRDIAYQQITDELEYASSNYLCSIKYLQKELFVDSTVSSDTEFPVLLMDWVEGVTLDKYVHQHISDKYALQLITYQFCRMAAWLMSQPFAHGDLKPDNILVTEDGALVLVDYDGMYVPAMQGQKARELGSPDYRHPLRTEDCFNEHIDDFPLALIGMSLKAIALDTSLLQNNAKTDSLLFSESDFHNIGECLMMKSLCALLNDAEFSKLYALFLLAHSQQELSAVSFRLFLLNKVEKPIEEVLSTKTTEEDLKDAIIDEYGVKYSRDGKKLLEALCGKEYVVREGTEVICDEAFRWCKSLQSVTIPNSVKSIGDYAFSSCKSLQSVTIPNSVKSIGDYAFSGCKSLQSVTIPNSVTSIGNWAFCWCVSLQSVTIPNSVKSIGDKAFSDCHSLQSVTIPNSVTSIGNEAFSRCKSLQYVTIPNSVTSIGDGVFGECVSLQSVTIPNSVTSIGNSAFFSCESLQSVTIPNSVTNIGNSAFYWCRSLQSITIPSSVTKIGDYAFELCESLQSITIPNSVTSIRNGAFSRCYSLQNVTIPNSVTSIGNEAFSGCKSLQNVTIPNSVTSIGNEAFSRCKSLQYVTIPNSVTSIGDGVFRECVSLQSVTIPNSVTKIGDYAFSGCESLQSITIPNSVTSIEEGAFFLCKSLQSITIPSSVTKIGDGAFGGCNICFFICNSTYFQNDDVCLFNKDKTAIVSRIKNCVNYIIPNSVTKIGDGTFCGCYSLQSVTIPNSVTSIGNGAFIRCYSLQSVTIPNSVTSIGDGAFYGCYSLQSVTIPNSVTKIGNGAFNECTHLDEPSRLRLKELNYTQIDY
ncbi:leucine-rich repeat protein [Segatella sp.]|uniref:leucine-rich repeat protein n=1 Tax=Segatella sp. TaxID=2974253 RepID=UPI003077093B